MPSYLIRRRGQGFAFRIAVPMGLRGRFKSARGTPLSHITEGLGTDSEREARRLAERRLVHWRTAFARAHEDAPLALAEIEEAARAYYRRTLALLHSQAPIMAELIGGEQEWLTRLRDNPGDMAGEVAEIERQRGTSLPVDNDTRVILIDALRRAHVAAVNGRLRALDGEPSSPPASFLGAAGIDKVTLKPIELKTPRVSVRAPGPLMLFEQWVSEAKPAISTVNRLRPVFEALQDKFGSREITEDDARDWARGLITGKRSARTAHDIWLIGARTIYNHALAHKRVDSNPFKGAKINVPDPVMTRDKSFTDDEAKLLLSAASKIDWHKGAFAAATRWCPWLAAYSGARMGELTQLRGQDIEQHDGIWCMRLTPDAGTIKTKQYRLVPLHEHLIEQGFLDFVKQSGDGPLFYRTKRLRGEDDPMNPRRPRSVKCRERLAVWARTVVKDKRVSPNHAWRHLFKLRAERAGIPERLNDALTGHAPLNVARRYGTPQVQDLATALAKFPQYSA